MGPQAEREERRTCIAQPRQRAAPDLALTRLPCAKLTRSPRMARDNCSQEKATQGAAGLAGGRGSQALWERMGERGERGRTGWRESFQHVLGLDGPWWCGTQPWGEWRGVWRMRARQRSGEGLRWKSAL